VSDTIDGHFVVAFPSLIHTFVTRNKHLEMCGIRI